MFRHEVSRKVLKEPYQGQLEADESENSLDNEEEEDSFETDDYPESTQATATPSSSHVVDEGYPSKPQSPQSTGGGRFFGIQLQLFAFLITC